MPLSQVRGESKRFADVWLLDLWEIGQQLFDRAAGGHRLDDHSDGHAQAPYAWLATHDLGIHRNAAEWLHETIIAWEWNCR